MVRERGRQALAWVTLPLVTVIFSVGGAVASSSRELSSKMDTTAFALYRADQRMRDTMLVQSVAEIRADVRVLVCDRFLRQPRCLR